MQGELLCGGYDEVDSQYYEAIKDIENSMNVIGERFRRKVNYSRMVHRSDLRRHPDLDINPCEGLPTIVSDCPPALQSLGSAKNAATQTLPQLEGVASAQKGSGAHNSKLCEKHQWQDSTLEAAKYDAAMQLAYEIEKKCLLAECHEIARAQSPMRDTMLGDTGCQCSVGAEAQNGCSGSPRQYMFSSQHIAGISELQGLEQIKSYCKSIRKCCPIQLSFFLKLFTKINYNTIQLFTGETSMFQGAQDKNRSRTLIKPNSSDFQQLVQGIYDCLKGMFPFLNHFEDLVVEYCRRYHFAVLQKNYKKMLQQFNRLFKQEYNQLRSFIEADKFALYAVDERLYRRQLVAYWEVCNGLMVGRSVRERMEQGLLDGLAVSRMGEKGAAE